MEGPPLSTPPPTTPTTPTPEDSADSSPRFRKNLSWDAEPPPPAKLRLMCSYGGHIVPRPHDKTLCYVGGDTRIIVIDRHTSLSDLHRRLSRNLFAGQPFSLKYQLPSEDLDSLITITSDEDLENMVEEYDRLNNAGGGGGTKQGRLRLFLFPRSSSSIEQLLMETASTKSDDWFFNALNGKASSFSAAASDRGFSESSSLNCLLGLDDEFAGKAAAVRKDVGTLIEGSKNSGVNRNVNGNYVINQDIHSVPDSPMLDTTSSFDSSSSSPNLPPIRVHVDENPKVGLGASGIEEQFQQMSVGVAGNVNPPLPQKKEEVGGFIGAGAAASGTVVSVFPVVVGGEYPNRVVSDDERSDNSGHRKAQQVQLQPPQIPPQFIQKPANAFDLSSPDSVSSDGSIANPLSRQRQAVYHEQLLQIQSGNSRISSNQADLKTVDQNNKKIQIQPQFQESSYQYDQNQPQLHQPQQFVHPNSHYIPSSAMPVASYYSVYPSQQPHHPHQSVLDQPYPVYFMAPNAPSSHSQMPPPAYNQTRTPPSSKPETASGVYRTTAPQLVQVPSTQHQPQYVGYTPIHHPSSVPNSNYSYEFADPSHAQLYYTPLPPQLAAQYQMAPPDATTETIKQQVRN